MYESGCMTHGSNKLTAPHEGARLGAIKRLPLRRGLLLFPLFEAAAVAFHRWSNSGPRAVR